MHQEKFDLSCLASVKVDTPDPRKEDFIAGQKLLVAWDFPKSLFSQGLTLKMSVRLWDNQEEQILIPVERKRDTVSYFFPSSNKILTYQILALTAEGRIIDTWEHQFWTPLIQIDETRSTVSSQPKHSSVTETP